MDRLDEVCGPANWQDRYEFHGPRTICYLSIRVDGEWITKADGAGDSDVEAEKGAISDALKRSAVKWGIARYLYNMPNVWAPCESYERGGKRHWSKWLGDPWDHVRNAPDRQPVKSKSMENTADANQAATTTSNEARKSSAAEQKRAIETIKGELIDCRTPNDVKKLLNIWADTAEKGGWSNDYWDEARRQFARRKAEIEAQSDDDDFPGSTPGNTGIRNPAGRELHTLEGV